MAPRHNLILMNIPSVVPDTIKNIHGYCLLVRPSMNAFFIFNGTKKYVCYVKF